MWNELFFYSFTKSLMSYEKDIFTVLREAGPAGLSVKKIARHVFNAHNGLFESASESEISGAVQRYLAYHSKRPKDTIEKVSRGRYRLNMKSRCTKELMLKFSDDDCDNRPSQPVKDQSLSLFPSTEEE